MSKLSIKNKLYLCSGLLPFSIALLAVIMYWLNAGMASNVNFTNTDNLILKSLPFITNYLHILFDISFIAVSVSIISYARVHFGPATSIKVSLMSVAAFAASEIFSYCFSIIYNSFNIADFKAKLISLAVELVYISALMFLTPLLSSLYIRKTTNKGSKPSRLKIGLASLPSIGIYFAIKIAELTTYTISAVKSYISHGNIVSSAMIISIIVDVLYYIVLYLAVPISIALLTSYMLVRLTGPLKLKIKGDSVQR